MMYHIERTNIPNLILQLHRGDVVFKGKVDDKATSKRHSTILGGTLNGSNNLHCAYLHHCRSIVNVFHSRMCLTFAPRSVYIKKYCP